MSRNPLLFSNYFLFPKKSPSNVHIQMPNSKLRIFLNINHYYRNTNLSRLGNPCCPGFPTGNARPGQKGGPFVPGLATGTKDYLLSRLVTPTGTKGCASHVALAAPFVPVVNNNRDKKSLFFPVFLFSILFLFQLYFYISIKLIY